MAMEIQELKNGRAVFTCNTANLVFGPIMSDFETAEEFEQHLLKTTRAGDVRRIPLDDLHDSWDAWRAEREEGKDPAVRSLHGGCGCRSHADSSRVTDADSDARAAPAPRAVRTVQGQEGAGRVEIRKA